MHKAAKTIPAKMAIMHSEVWRAWNCRALIRSRSPLGFAAGESCCRGWDTIENYQLESQLESGEWNLLRVMQFHKTTWMQGGFRNNSLREKASSDSGRMNCPHSYNIHTWFHVSQINRLPQQPAARNSRSLTAIQPHHPQPPPLRNRRTSPPSDSADAPAPARSGSPPCPPRHRAWSRSRRTSD